MFLTFNSGVSIEGREADKLISLREKRLFVLIYNCTNKALLTIWQSWQFVWGSQDYHMAINYCDCFFLLIWINVISFKYYYLLLSICCVLLSLVFGKSSLNLSGSVNLIAKLNVNIFYHSWYSGSSFWVLSFWILSRLIFSASTCSISNWNWFLTQIMMSLAWYTKPLLGMH